jgi:dTDP-glucose pyrophosphorylase/CBS domain-containing protein
MMSKGDMNDHLANSITGICLSSEDTIGTALGALERTHKEIVLIVDENRRLVGTVTDGDVRRAILKGKTTRCPLGQVMNGSPLVGNMSMSNADLIRYMGRHHILQLPIVDESGIIIDVALLGDLVQEKLLANKAVIMAGGQGRRLRPLTNDIPKPLLPIADRPILDIIIDQLRSEGIDEVFIITHYKAEMIEGHISRSSYPGLKFHIVREAEPRGTAGGLALLRDYLEQPFIVMNADILTRLSFTKLLKAHVEKKATLSVVTKRREIQIPYGVIESDKENAILSFTEKPVIAANCNIGVYAMSPEALASIPNDGYFDITDLIEELQRRQAPLYEYPIEDYWIDIGRISDYERACEDMLESRF